MCGTTTAAGPSRNPPSGKTGRRSPIRPTTTPPPRPLPDRTISAVRQWQQQNDDQQHPDCLGRTLARRHGRSARRAGDVSRSTVCATGGGRSSPRATIVVSGVSITDQGPASVGTAAMAFRCGCAPVDYRDDELDVVTDGDDLGLADLDDLRDVDDD